MTAHLITIKWTVVNQVRIAAVDQNILELAVTDTLRFEHDKSNAPQLGTPVIVFHTDSPFGNEPIAIQDSTPRPVTNPTDKRSRFKFTCSAIVGGTLFVSPQGGDTPRPGKN